MIDPFNISPMKAARLLATIKQDKDAAGARLMELDAHHCANLRRFARITHFTESTKSNSVTNLERVYTTYNQDLSLFRKIRSLPDLHDPNSFNF
jgi:hypothetical protein